MKIKKSQLRKIIKEGIRVVLNESDAMNKEQKAFVMKYYKKAGSKLGFKTGRVWRGLGGHPNMEVKVYSYGVSSSSMTNIWGQAFSKSDAMKIKKAWEDADLDLKTAERGYKPKFYIGTDHHYLSLWDALSSIGEKLSPAERKEYHRLFKGGN